MYAVHACVAGSPKEDDEKKEELNALFCGEFVAELSKANCQQFLTHAVQASCPNQRNWCSRIEPFEQQRTARREIICVGGERQVGVGAAVWSSRSIKEEEWRKESL
jgi:hypothetical protein